MVRILVLYYSATGNVFKMAQAVAKGVVEVSDAMADLRRVPETLPPESAKGNPAMKAAAKAQRDVSVATLADLEKCDGLVLGTPTRFGNMCQQMKAFIDTTGKLWVEGFLTDKPAGVFCSTGTLHGGQETTLITSYIPLLHHGMILLGVPPNDPDLAKANRGGSYYGASAVVGSRTGNPPTENDLAIAQTLGRRVAWVASKLK
jgi:NAD(P)H dehydrogenase (quinone)